MKQRTTLATLSVGLALFAGACNKAPSQDGFKKTQAIAFEEAFAGAKQYWRSKHENIGDTKLTLLNGDNKSSCGRRKADGAKLTGTDIVELYCINLGEIVISKALSEAAYLKSPSDFVAIARFLVGHETGHAVQDANDLYGEVPTQELELQADCLAGEMMEAKFPESVATVEQSSALLGGDGHGTASQRLQSFATGAEEGVC